jgi:two-component system NarL family response regulator
VAEVTRTSPGDKVGRRTELTIIDGDGLRPTMAQIRILLVENHRLVAEALVCYLDSQPELEVVAVAAGLEEALALAGPGSCEVLVVDHDLPDGSAVELLERLEAEDRRPPSLVLADSGQPADLIDAVRAGANAVLSKSAHSDDLVAAIRVLAAGGGHLDPEVLGAVLDALRVGSRREVTARVPGIHRLSDRERDVLQCLVDGMERHDIASSLFVSVNTVRTHVRRILQKLEVHSQLEAVRLARTSGMHPRKLEGLP